MNKKNWLGESETALIDGGGTLKTQDETEVKKPVTVLKKQKKNKAKDTVEIRLKDRKW